MKTKNHENKNENKKVIQNTRNNKEREKRY